MSQFQREERYIVVKIKDAQAVDSEEPFNGYDRLRDFLKQECIPTREGLVIEKDWPEYEPTWAAIERRVTGKAPAWDGVGWPSVGADVEFLDGSKGAWVPGVAIGFDEKSGTQAMIVRFENADGGYEYRPAFELRPIRTPEQIAAEKYEADAADLAEVMTGHRDRSKDCYLHMAKVILDAGYRKQVAP